MGRTLKRKHPFIMITKILVWNVKGWWAKKEEIKEKIIGFDIVILTETKSRIRI